ncbi:MAG: GNAT family N-acetyltransferase, partial [Lachnospiraceae bacterium]|nr:GNAT family N-acetyltransferase [Lachnospiraceae bacterium]
KITSIRNSCQCAIADTFTFNHAARVFIATCNGDLCAFCAVLPFPHPKKKNTWKEHRSVVLPDFQGVGIGTVFTDAVAELFAQEGKTFISTTSNPAMIHSRAKNKKWRTTRIGRVSGGVRTAKLKASFSTNRLTVSFEYIGDKSQLDTTN